MHQMHVLVSAREKLQWKRVCLLSDLSLGWIVFFSLPFGVVQPSSYCSYSSALIFLIFAVLPQHSSGGKRRVWCFCRHGEFPVPTSVPLLGSHKN